jgi:hypothetical protein
VDLDIQDRNQTIYAVREGRGSDVPVEVLGENFAGTVLCDGWTAYPAFSNNLQRCWNIFFGELGVASTADLLD